MLGLAAWIALCFAAAATGAIWLPGEWYAQLQKPSWTPPDAVFGPVWTVLYALLLLYLAWVGFAAALNFALWRMN